MKPPSIRRHSGAVLLEVVLALVLFVAAAAVVTNALNTSVNSVERMRLRAEGADLAVTLLSEVELGLRSRTPAPPAPTPAPHTNWTWEVVSDADPGLGLPAPARVEVVLRHADPPFVVRQAAWLPVTQSGPGGTSDGTEAFPMEAP